MVYSQPILKNWISERYDPKKITEWAKQNSLSWIEKARKLPEIAETAVEQINKMEMHQKKSEERHQELLNKLSNEKRFFNLIIVSFAIIAVGFLIS